MKRKFTFLLLSLFLGLSTWAAPRLVVWQKNGEKVFYELADEPKTSFEKGKLIIVTDKVRVEYQLSNILRYTYEGFADAIEETEPTGTGFQQKGNDVRVYGVPKGTDVKLYNASGQLLSTVKADGTSAVHFSLSNKPSGVYIVSFGDESLKFMKR